MGWVEQALEHQDRLYRALNQKANSEGYSTSLRSTAPGWLYQGIEITCIPDQTYPWDPKVVKAIQKIAPDIVPIWVRYIYKEPTDWGTNRLHVIGRHGLACVNKTPGVDPNPFQCRMPQIPCQGVYFERPNQIEYIFKGKEDINALDLPGEYIPFDWAVYDFVKASYRKNSFAEMKDHYITKPLEARRKREQKQKEEAAYRARDFQKYAARKLEQASEVEAKEYFLGLGRHNPEVKPYVFQGK
jgi:hypothetical protein